MAFVQMQKLEEIGQIRRKNHALIVDIFKPYENYFYLPNATEGSDPDWFAVALTIKDDAGFTRADFCQYLESNKIQTRPYLKDILSNLTDIFSKHDLNHEYCGIELV